MALGAAAGEGVIAGAGVRGWSAATAGAKAEQHNATAIAAARAIEAIPRSELSYNMGLSFLVIRAMMHPL